METRVKKLYKSAIKDGEFLKDIYGADKDKKPGILADTKEIIVFTSMYYGWLLGKFGVRGIVDFFK